MPAWRGMVDVVGIATTRRNQAIADAVFRAFPVVIPGVFNQPVAVVITDRGWIAAFACHLIVEHKFGPGGFSQPAHEVAIICAG